MTSNYTAVSDLNETTEKEDVLECIHQDMYLPRALATAFLSVITLENLLLLIAIVVHWPKFHSNLYRFVASLVCADLFIGFSNLAVVGLKLTSADLSVTAILKGTSYVAFVASTFSISLLNVSARYTYARSGDGLLQVRRQNKSKTTSLRYCCRQSWIARTLITGTWTLLVVLVIISFLTRCNAENDQCVNNCPTFLRDSHGRERPLCKSNQCSRYNSPLSFAFVFLINIISWISFLFLIGSTVSVVFVKISIVPESTHCKVNAVAFSEANKESPDVPDLRVLGGPVSEFPSKSAEHVAEEVAVDGTNNEKGNAGLVIKRSFGFNKDFIARFSISVTLLQLIFWLPVSILTLRGFISESSFSSYYGIEMTNLIFFIPSLLDPWICLFTMGKLREAVSSTYLARCKCYFT